MRNEKYHPTQIIRGAFFSILFSWIDEKYAKISVILSNQATHNGWSQWRVIAKEEEVRKEKHPFFHISSFAHKRREKKNEEKKNDFFSFENLITLSLTSALPPCQLCALNFSELSMCLLNLSQEADLVPRYPGRGPRIIARPMPNNHKVHVSRTVNYLAKKIERKRQKKENAVHTHFSHNKRDWLAFLSAFLLFWVYVCASCGSSPDGRLRLMLI